MTNTKNHGGKRKGAGPPKKPTGEKMCFPVLSIKENDLAAYGGLDKLKEDIKIMVKTKLK